MLRAFVILLLGFCGGSLSAQAPSVVERPNVVWIMSEDNSIHYLQHFFPGGATAPAIESLASEGLTFRNAFSCSPVCSVARTTLITGCYAPRLATQYHRRSQLIQLPEGLKMFPAELRQAGYYTTNNSKEDYNITGAKQAWDDSSRRASWRGRPTPETPFFHVQTFGMSHESSLHFSEQVFRNEATQHDPAALQPHPYLPDTALVRYTHARYLDRMQVIDRAVEKLIGQLKEDGVWDNTIVFYFGDHGGVLPRSKGYIYDVGLHVPLVVRFPEKYLQRWQLVAGADDDRFVEFVDFGPTVLSLAGIEVPPLMDGQPFLGESTASDDQFTEALGYADRFDEKIDMTRSLHRGRYHYIRNYQPFYPDGLQNNYRYKMLAYQQWRGQFHAGMLNSSQTAFFEARPAELLFDLQHDPFEVNNLANDPEFSGILRDLRTRLQARLKALPDLSLFPESIGVPAAAKDPLGFGNAQQTRIGKLLEIADLCLSSPSEIDSAWQQAVTSDDPWQKYWALTAAASFADQPLPTAWHALAKQALQAEQPLVRGRAAVMLAVTSEFDPRAILTEAVEQATSENEALLLLNEIVYLRDHLAIPFVEVSQCVPEEFRKGEVARRIEYLN